MNVLALTGSFFMLQVYDRVIPAQSLPTLAGLAIIAATLFTFQGILELLRSMLLVRVGLVADERLSAKVYSAVLQVSSRQRLPGDGLQPVRDLDQVRSFLSSTGPTALFDLPWMPFYIGICFLFHFWIGMTALAGAILLVLLTAVAEIKSRRPARMATEYAAQRLALAAATRQNAEVLTAMGFGDRMTEKWLAVNSKYLRTQVAASDVAGGLSVVSRILRMMLQSGILAVGAILVIQHEATAGIMIASSILMSRALAPVELAIGHWKAFASARQSWQRLTGLLASMPVPVRKMSLPAPRSSLIVEDVVVFPPASRRVALQHVAFRLEKGSVLGIIGPSASGKSSLARVLTGIWSPARGSVRLDRASLDQWHPSELGAYIGYLPQDVGLFDGTIGENIARFDGSGSSEKILAAAKAAGIHDMVVQLPDGFETRTGEGGSMLSAGQRQRIALARALYGDPFLVVLDEPNSNLDTDGDAALRQAILGVRDRDGIAIIVSHRPSILGVVDQILILGDGQIQAFGPRDEILRKVTRPDAVQRNAANVAPHREEVAL